MKLILIEDIQEDFPVWENIVLVDSGSPEEAVEAARNFGIDEEGTAENSMKWNGKRARWAFAGIRKLVSCVDLVNHANLDGKETKVGHGTEITYFQFTMKSLSDVDDFLTGKEVDLKLSE